MDRKEQGRGSENQNPELSKEALPEGPGRSVSMQGIIEDFATYASAQPHLIRRLLADLTCIAAGRGCLAPNPLLVPYKPEYLARMPGIRIVDGEAILIDNEEKMKPAEPDYQRTPEGNLVLQIPLGDEPYRVLLKSDPPPQLDAGPQPVQTREDLLRGFVNVFEDLDRKPDEFEP